LRRTGRPQQRGAFASFLLDERVLRRRCFYSLLSLLCLSTPPCSLTSPSPPSSPPAVSSLPLRLLSTLPLPLPTSSTSPTILLWSSARPRSFPSPSSTSGTPTPVVTYVQSSSILLSSLTAFLLAVEVLDGLYYRIPCPYVLFHPSSQSISQTHRSFLYSFGCRLRDQQLRRRLLPNV
jgi:hypothetical protein